LATSGIGKDTTEHIMWHRSLEQAIEFACRLINDGCDVYGFDVGSLANSITRDEIVSEVLNWDTT
jgi:hypothetical protein